MQAYAGASPAAWRDWRRRGSNRMRWWHSARCSLVTIVPFTLIVILPTNARLLDPALDAPRGRGARTLQRWGRLHCGARAASRRWRSLLRDESGGMTTRIRCGWATTPLGIAYHDKEWGVPGARRPRALRVHHPRRGTGWPELGDDSQEARRLPRGVRRLRSGQGRALHAGTGREAPAGPRHRPQPAEGREHGHQRQGVPGGPAGVRELRSHTCGTSWPARRSSTAGAR